MVWWRNFCERTLEGIHRLFTEIDIPWELGKGWERSKSEFVHRWVVVRTKIESFCTSWSVWEAVICEWWLLLMLVLWQGDVFQVVPKWLVYLCWLNHRLIVWLAWPVLKWFYCGVDCCSHVFKLDFFWNLYLNHLFDLMGKLCCLLQKMFIRFNFVEFQYTLNSWNLVNNRFNLLFCLRDKGFKNEL